MKRRSPNSVASKGRRPAPAARAPLKVSLVINTACFDPATSQQTNPYRSKQYAERQAILREEVLPRSLAAGFDEIIVAGVFPPDLRGAFPMGVMFVDVAPQRRNRWDGLLQREVGARFSTGDLIVFCHDDHAPGEDFGRKLKDLHLTTDGLGVHLSAVEPWWDILCPKRIHAGTGVELNNGAAQWCQPGQEPYMGAHCYVMRRPIWAALPLTSAPTEWWDIHLSAQWRKMGARIAWTEELAHYDIEATEVET